MPPATRSAVPAFLIDRLASNLLRLPRGLVPLQVVARGVVSVALALAGPALPRAARRAFDVGRIDADPLVVQVAVLVHLALEVQAAISRLLGRPPRSIAVAAAVARTAHQGAVRARGGHGLSAVEARRSAVDYDLDRREAALRDVELHAH